MVQASLLEQLNIFWNILISNKYIWIILGIALGLVLLLSLGNKFHNKKITKILYILIYVTLFGTLIGLFHTEILELYDYLVNNIFLFLFFPNLAVYALVLLIVNIIIIKSTFSKDYKVVKGLNIVFFIVFNIIFYLIIDNIVKNNINVYEQLNVYTNNNLLVLIELSMKLFVVWLLLLGIIKVSKSIAYSISLSKATNKNLIKVETINNKELERVNTLSKVMEIKPNVEYIPEINYNDNDYVLEDVDIVPIKKTKETKIEQLEDIDIVNDIDNKVNPFTDFNIVDSKKLEEEVKPSIITLSSYDSIFKVNKDIENNMNIVFEDNKLNNIINDIHELGKDINDNNLKNVYDKIIVSQDELSLSDYNYLINELITLKK